MKYPQRLKKGINLTISSQENIFFSKKINVLATVIFNPKKSFMKKTKNRYFTPPTWEIKVDCANSFGYAAIGL
ncbi:MAG: hypothetical protein ACK40K_08530 [Raineya sp.]